jgi:trimeric autotransporter adhesin
MGGLSTDATGATVVYGDNVDFSGANNPQGQVTLNGQLLIGSTALPHIRVGTLTAGTGVTITNGPGTITIALAGGGTVIETITGNDSVAESPSAGNFNIVTANATVKFLGTAATETLNFNLTNLVLGSSLPALTSGIANVGMGATALSAITSGGSNTALGSSAGLSLNTGSSNTAVGQSALVSITSGSTNVAIGNNALALLATSSSSNTALGASSLSALGGIAIRNIALGFSAGSAYTTTESSNILLGNIGVVAESNVMRLGTNGSGTGQQSSCFIAGINGITNTNALLTTINSSTSQMGVIASVNNAVLTTGTAGIPVLTSLASNGQLIIGSGSGAPAAATLTAGTGITITNAANSITIASTGSSLVLNYTNVNHAASPYTVLTTDYYLSIDSSGGVVSLLFPNAPTFKQTWIVKDRTGSASTNNISVTTVGGSVTIDGQTTYKITSNFGAIQLLANGTPTYEIY